MPSKVSHVPVLFQNSIYECLQASVHILLNSRASQSSTLHSCRTFIGLFPHNGMTETRAWHPITSPQSTLMYSKQTRSNRLCFVAKISKCSNGSFTIYVQILMCNLSFKKNNVKFSVPWFPMRFFLFNLAIFTEKWNKE